MAFLVSMFGGLIVGIGLFGLIRPRGLVEFIRSTWESPSGLPIAVTLRLVLGATLLAAAASSRFPLALSALGVLMILTAAALPILGADRFRDFVQWWVERPGPILRAWSGVAILFGALLIYAVW
jgi:hypothetical protein